MDNTQPNVVNYPQFNLPYIFLPEVYRLNYPPIFQMNPYMPFFQYPISYPSQSNTNQPQNDDLLILQNNNNPIDPQPQERRRKKKKTIRYNPITVKFHTKKAKFEGKEEAIEQQLHICKFYDPAKAPSYTFCQQDIYDPLKFRDLQNYADLNNDDFDKNFFAQLEQKYANDENGADILQREILSSCQVQRKSKRGVNKQKKTIKANQPNDKLSCKVKSPCLSKKIFFQKHDVKPNLPREKITRKKTDQYIKETNSSYKVDSGLTKKIFSKSGSKVSHNVQERNYKKSLNISNAIQKEPDDFSESIENDIDDD